MEIEKIAGASPPALDRGTEKFSKLLESPKAGTKAPASPTARSEVAPQRIEQPNPTRAATVQRAIHGKCEVKPGARVDSAQQARSQQAVKMIDHVSAAQHRLDKVLALSQSGKTFTPAELLSLQAQVYSATQELDLAGKVVEKATAGVKQVLQTQV
jgi:hypothetical protein